MNVVYVESSAILEWLLGGAHKATVEDVLAEAPSVVTSVLTRAEVDRTLARLEATKAMTHAGAEAARTAFDAEREGWFVAEISEGTWARLANAFPVEPVRTLDGIHLATIEELARDLHVMTVLTLDDRVRKNAVATGLSVAPRP